MPLKRFLLISRASLNFNNGDLNARRHEDVIIDTNKQHQTVEMDPIERREAEYYANLELKRGSSFEDIKKAYKRMMKKYHPDHYSEDPDQKTIAEAIASKLNEAFSYFEKKFDNKIF